MEKTIVTKNNPNPLFPLTKTQELINIFLKNNDAFTGFDAVMLADTQINREIYLGAIEDGVAEAVDSFIRFWNRVDEQNGVAEEDRIPIKRFINSPGGLLTGAFTIINAIENSATPVWTYNTGEAYSAGFFIFIAGHKRFAYRDSSFLFHEGATSTGDSYIDAHKFRNHASFYEKQLARLELHVLKYSKWSKEKYEKVRKDDYWFFADEALEEGLVDEIL